MGEEEKEIVDNIYSVCLTNGFAKIYTERELKKNTEELIGAGEIDRQLSKLRLTLEQLLRQSERFENRGPGRWRACAASADSHLLDSIADKKNNRSSRGGRSGGGGGGSSRGRGGASGSQRGNSGGGNRGFGAKFLAIRRGNAIPRSHGSAFRDPPAPPPPANNRPLINNRPPPQNDYSSQRPLVRPAPPLGPPDYDRDRDRDLNYRDPQPYNRGPSNNSRYDDHPRYDRPISPQFRRSPSPPPGLSRDNYNSQYHQNEPRGYYVGPPPNRYPEDRCDPPRYDRPDNRYVTYDNEYDDYGYDDHNYSNRRRTPTPPPPPPPQRGYRDRSPPRGNGYGPSYDAPYRNDSRASDSRSNYNGSNYNEPYRAPSTRAYSPPPPPVRRSPSPVYRNVQPMEPPGLPSRHVPPQYVDRDDPQPRPDSRASNVSEYSQFSADTNVQSVTSAARQRSRALADEATPVTLKMEDLAAKFNTKVTVSEPKVKKPSADYLFAQKVANNLLEGRSLFGPKILTYDALNILKKSGVQLPGSTIKENEDFIERLSKENPELFKDMNLDFDNDTIHYIGCPAPSPSPPPVAIPVRETTPPVDVTNGNVNFGTQYKREHLHVEDDAHFVIMRDIRSIISNKFNLTDLITRLCTELGMHRSEVTEKVTYLLFVTFENQYKYAGNTEEIVVLKNSGYRNKEYFEAFLLHDIFAEQRDYWKVDVCRFMKFEKFSVRPVELIDVFERIDKEINSDDNPRIDSPEGGWKPNHPCLVLYRSDNTGTRKWGRGLIIRCCPNPTDVSRMGYRILIIDQGIWVLLSSISMRTMPQKYRNIPPCAIQCSMKVEDDALTEMNLEFIGKPFTEAIASYSDKTYIQFTGEINRFDGIPTYGVQIFVDKLDGEKANITSYF